MITKQNFKKLIYLLLPLLLLVILAGGRNFLPAYALSDNINVLKELQKDKEFSAANYPVVKNDYSIQVIQIGESDRGNLYIFTYQPCQPVKYLVATDINMSLSEEADATQLYELVLVNTNGAFAKYLVKDIKVSSEAVRYYNITSIYRAWDKEIDGATGNNNTIDKKSYPVRRVYTATTTKGGVNYTYEPTYTVNIINPYSDYLLYTDYKDLPDISQIRLNFDKQGYIDAHYIASSTDWEIDKLMSATVTYRYCTGNGKYNTFLGFDFGGDLTYGTEQVGYAYPTYDEKFEKTGDYWHNGTAYSYSWERIQTVAEFIASESLTDETKTNLAGKQWVLRFLETQRTQTETGVLGYKKYKSEFTKVDKVAVLRLEFETDGRVYNLGTVSDMVSGDNSPGNVEPKPEEESFWDKVGKFFEKLWNNVKGFKWWHWLLIVLGVIAGIALIISIVSFGIKEVFKFIFWLIGKLIQGLWWLVTLPFRAIGGAIKNRKGKKK